MTARVVSLVPSATESLLAWNLEPIACTRFCEQPDIRHVGGTKDPSLDEIIDLAPDVVVMCEEENLLEHHEVLVEAGLSCHTLRIDSVEQVGPELDRLAEAVGVPPPAPADLELPPRVEASGIRAFVPIWRRPWMTLGPSCYGTSVLDHLGIENIFANADTRYPECDVAEIRRRNPDVVLAPTEPYPFGERHLPELRDLAPAHLVDGQDLFWWGTRTPDAVGRLAEALATLRRP